MMKMEKEFILDSEYKLVRTDTGYIFKQSNRELFVNESALEATRDWIAIFGSKYPGYVYNKQKQYEHFTR